MPGAHSRKALKLLMNRDRGSAELWSQRANIPTE
jgi:hypothetical protein